jgi:hypothetical protein
LSSAAGVASPATPPAGSDGATALAVCVLVVACGLRNFAGECLGDTVGSQDVSTAVMDFLSVMHTWGVYGEGA